MDLLIYLMRTIGMVLEAGTWILIGFAVLSAVAVSVAALAILLVGRVALRCTTRKAAE